MARRGKKRTNQYKRSKVKFEIVGHMVEHGLVTPYANKGAHVTLPNYFLDWTVTIVLREPEKVKKVEGDVK